jgi:ATP-dependent DNA helicase RecG
VRQTGAPPAGLATALQYVKGVGPQRAKLLAKKGLETVEDALFFLPIRHEDRTRLTPLRSIQGGQVVTCSGVIAGISPPPPGRARVPLVLLLRDASGYGTATIFGRGWLTRLFQRGQKLVLHGKGSRFKDKITLQVRTGSWSSPATTSPSMRARWCPCTPPPRDCTSARCAR